MKISAVELDDNDVVEIFITAMEGGINYWAVADEYKWRHLYADDDCTQAISLGDDYVLAVLSDAEGTDFKDLELTPFHIRRGVNWMLHSSYYININDIDANVADNIVQAGLFDEIVYG